MKHHSSWWVQGCSLWLSTLKPFLLIFGSYHYYFELLYSSPPISLTSIVLICRFPTLIFLVTHHSYHGFRLACFSSLVSGPISRSSLTSLMSYLEFHPSLEIEVDKYTWIPLEERICQLCHQGVESEEHYVCHCSVFYEIRGRYHCLFKQGFGPLRKVMEYEDQWCLELFLLELNRHRNKL